jgi:hypothetical protein
MGMIHEFMPCTFDRNSTGITQISNSSPQNRRRLPVPVITSSRRTPAAGGSSVWSSLDTRRSPIQRSSHSPILNGGERWGQNIAYIEVVASAIGSGALGGPKLSFGVICTSMSIPSANLRHRTPGIRRFGRPTQEAASHLGVMLPAGRVQHPLCGSGDR